MRRIVACEPGMLLEALVRAFPESPRTRLKQALRWSRVSVNGKPATRRDHPIAPGDVIVIGPSAPAPPPLPIVYEDGALLVVDKPAGLLTIATERERERTAYRMLTDYVRSSSPDPRARIFIVHRLDRDASGLCIFAKTAAAKRALQDGWEKAEKQYEAVVTGRLDPPHGEIRSRLAENPRTLRVFSASRGVSAVTRYRTLRDAGRYSLVRIDLVTGRKNQIRVHLSEAGHPIVGDRKYGSTADPAGRLALHACFLSFAHPETGRRLSFERPLPRVLRDIVGS